LLSTGELEITGLVLRREAHLVLHGVEGTLHLSLRKEPHVRVLLVGAQHLLLLGLQHLDLLLEGQLFHH
jgi:hypothetical protein